jgi:histidinol-phosphatase (PHP family)
MNVWPQDGHVHSEWSWDAALGSMTASCARAIEIGLPSIAFTEHADLTPWTVPAELAPKLPAHFRRWLRPDGVLAPPDLDLPGYLECVRQCRERFPDLRIVSGVELSEPHWHTDRADELLRAADFDRVLGSVHSLSHGGGHWETSTLIDRWPADRLVRSYLAEALRLVESPSAFTVLAHIDYPIRSWPAAGPPYEPASFEAEYRAVMTALAGTDRVLEINTKLSPRPELVRWWREAGGRAVSFGSDAHDPSMVGNGFRTAAALAQAHGFHPGRTPHDFWTR